MNPVAKFLVVTGLVLVVVGLLWQVGGRFFPLGRLPGDIAIEKENVRFYFPIVSSLVISLVLSLLLTVLGRFWR
ncbi:MAG TPA: DUF2905 domain-containing protein [Calditerricola sp.]|uniref:DUF2905 domain-containing protein n=1 Tax=Calditerricola satsumensis TaxID=373054 RepID=A0A8J3FCT3_9BACI|nr:DUF2905 domain-containing protein [Calditerricola satsumensis]GGK01624.1 hypothetical protein GCM10007043_14590 [Calditerricola satsumensis]